MAYDGGGPLTTALLGNKIDVGFSSVGELGGQVPPTSLWVLAVPARSGRGRGDGRRASPSTEAGIDLVFTNWRGVFAPPGITDERARS